jgi:hypothetical protein
MQFARFTLTGFLVSLLVLFSACGGSSVSTVNGVRPVATGNANTQNSKAPNTNVEELGLLVNVQFEVEDVVWKEDATKKTILAVLRFSPADAAKIVAQAETFGQPMPGAISPEQWFPSELIAQSEMSGDNVLKGQTYSADGFLQPPYSKGKLTRIESTDYFVLEAAAN